MKNNQTNVNINTLFKMIYYHTCKVNLCYIIRDEKKISQPPYDSTIFLTIIIRLRKCSCIICVFLQSASLHPESIHISFGVLSGKQQTSKHANLYLPVWRAGSDHESTIIIFSLYLFLLFRRVYHIDLSLACITLQIIVCMNRTTVFRSL